MEHIKNIEADAVLAMTDQVAVAPGQVISKTLAQNAAISITLFAFSKGEEIGAHESDGDAMVQLLQGVGRFTVGGRQHVLKAGQTLIMPAHVRHAVLAQEDFKMLLTVVF